MQQNYYPKMQEKTVKKQGEETPIISSPDLPYSHSLLPPSPEPFSLFLPCSEDALAVLPANPTVVQLTPL